MAQEPENGRNASGIARAGKRRWGYDPTQVDAFLERAHTLYESEGAQLTQQDIQNVSFDLRKNGYVISQVDAALARLERAVVDKRTTWEITRNGRVAWKAQTEELYRSIARHASRAARERFGDGKPKAPSYDRRQVDRLVDQIVDKAAAELGLDGVTEADVRKLVDLNASSVANVIFTQRKGRRGYDERQVDHFLNACVRLLSRIESYARVADYIGDAEGPSRAAGAAATATVPSLFPETDAGATMPVSFAPAASGDSGDSGDSDDFDALSKAEQAIFTAPAPAPQAPVVPAPAPVRPSPEPAAAMPPSFAPSVV
ncbi:DivIVA domain-containing protein, partial [Bifidobacterium phasiani]